jgi:hypothetical protein
MPVSFLDFGATNGAAPEEDKPDLGSTSKMSRKMFMFPNGCTIKATNKFSSSITFE